jgi:hypothetical protein
MICAGPASAQSLAALEFGAGAGKSAYEPPSPADLSAWSEIIVEGEAGAGGAQVLLRVDDAASSGYADRYNLELTYPPGPFRFRAPVTGMRAPNGRTIDARSIARVIVAPLSGDITIKRFAAIAGVKLPPGARAYAFGGTDTPVHPGFERVVYNDPRIEGTGVFIVKRPSPDPLIATGLRGVRRIRLPAEPGRVRVTLWTEDPGEWEYLPHPLRRTITVNGAIALQTAQTAEEWIVGRYLAGKWREHSTEDDAWTAFGRWRGGMVSADVTVGSDGVVIEFEGGDPSATFISAAVVQRLDAGVAVNAAEEAVLSQRANWYRDLWPVSRDGAQAMPSAELTLKPNGMAGAPLRAILAPDTGMRLTISVTSEAAIGAPAASLAPLRNERGGALPVTLWAALWKLERLEPGARQLHLTENMLVADTGRAAIEPSRPRRYDIWIAAPAGAAPGIYKGAFSIMGAERRGEIPIEIEVLPTSVPDAPKPAGYYLAYAPHLDWFARLRLDRDRQAACDLRFMAGLGLRGAAPPVNPLTALGLHNTVSDIRRADALGVTPGWLAYNPLHALMMERGVEKAALLAGQAQAAITAAGLAGPYWSAADEISNADQKIPDVREWVAALRRSAPGIRLAGHLNTPSDARYVPLFDAVLINAGFGLDAADIARYAQPPRRVWIYNSFAPRLTAGLWLWRTAASRYVQWHARMPTADPFDPLDGREGDAQMFYPSQIVCPPQPDIHRDLLRMAEGVVDQRWLTWLDARSDPTAVALKKEIAALAGSEWSAAIKLTNADLHAIRAKIMALAKLESNWPNDR